MITMTRSLRGIALACLVCPAWLVGCNAALGIDPPASQLLQSDGGTIVQLRDAGSQTGKPASTFAPPATTGEPPKSAPAVDSGKPMPPAADAGASDAAAMTSTETQYVWANWPMPNPQSTGLPNVQSYATLASGRVADKITHLEWQQFGDDTLRTWSDAVAYCEGLMLGGGLGWRLPSRIELLSLVDFTSASPALDAQTFSGTVADSFWSASPFVGARSSAWGVNFAFHDGFVFTDDMHQPHRARCVR